MDTNWNLDNLYTSYEGDKFLNDLENFEKVVKDFSNWCNDNFNNAQNAKEKLEIYLQKLNDLSVFDSLIAYVYLNLKVDTTNSKLLNLSSKIEKIIVDVKQIENYVTLFLKDINNLDNIINYLYRFFAITVQIATMNM